MAIGKKQIARFGLFFLKEAVLDVLLEAGETDTPQLQPNEISKRLGIERATRGSGSLGYALIHGVLNELLKENRVGYVESSQTWIIAPQEVEHRREKF